MADEAAARRCAWCDAVAPAQATTCAACGAALAQREDLGGLLIPGVTGVHPELAAAADRPLHIAGPSPSQGLAPGLIAVVAAPGPAGLAIGAGIAALAAAEYLGVPSSAGAPAEAAEVGRPSDSAVRMVERLDAQDRDA